MKYKCIIFDCDGVLVDSEGISNSVLIEMAKEIGVKITHEYALENFSGKSLKNCLAYIENVLGEKLPNDFESRFRNKTFSAFKTDLQPINGIHELLNQIEVSFCVASSGPPEKIKLNLTTTHLINHFEDRIFSSYDIGSWKPNPEIFLYAAKKMGFEIAECVVIEDSITGIQAAKAGGFDVIGFVNDNNKERFSEEKIIVCYDMKELGLFLK
jgi:HAD superfamily hydrolase (TIGR01509 family)